MTRFDIEEYTLSTYRFIKDKASYQRNAHVRDFSWENKISWSLGCLGMGGIQCLCVLDSTQKSDSEK